MSVKLRVHFDGKVIVPDEPVDLPVDRPLSAELEVITEEDLQRIREDALKAWDEFKANPITGLSISDESLRRKNLYEERS